MREIMFLNKRDVLVCKKKRIIAEYFFAELTELYVRKICSSSIIEIKFVFKPNSISKSAAVENKVVCTSLLVVYILTPFKHSKSCFHFRENQWHCFMELKSASTNIFLIELLRLFEKKTFLPTAKSWFNQFCVSFVHVLRFASTPSNILQFKASKDQLVDRCFLTTANSSIDGLWCPKNFDLLDFALEKISCILNCLVIRRVYFRFKYVVVDIPSWESMGCSS